MIRSLFKMFSTTAIALGVTSLAHAGIISCGDNYRSAGFSGADMCISQTIGSTAKQKDIDGLFGDSWTQVGALTNDGTSSFLTITGWGSSDASGGWAIDPNFWNQFGFAVISMHVGGGQKDAVDNFEWLITPFTLEGDWSYLKVEGKGGGLSNIKLWGSGAPGGTSSSSARSSLISVSEPSLLWLLAIGGVVLIICRSRRAY